MLSFYSSCLYLRFLAFYTYTSPHIWPFAPTVRHICCNDNRVRFLYRSPRRALLTI
ncbi:conserved hypothetical protein [Burkholderia cenocepacia]|nr:conserved hypothetical protein [Burkholderia cenocepacia]SOT39015.1 hypothetical protein F01_190041 [Burkholderia cenocepacia]